MSQKKPASVRMTAAEALFLSKGVSAGELNYCYNLYHAYYNNRQQLGCCGTRQWELMCLLSFFYHTGRIQGIRDERARRKAVFTPVEINMEKAHFDEMKKSQACF